jgi:hypothetical protein
MFFPGVASLPGMSATEFLDATYRAVPAVRTCFDVVAYHPYAYPFTSPEVDVPIRGSVISAADQLRAVLRRHHDTAKPLWITEVGWPTHDRSYGVSERTQARYVARMQAVTFSQRLPVITWYTYGDYADPTGANQEAWFGLFRPDGSAKPAYAALRTFSRTFRGARFLTDRSRSLGLPRGELLAGGRGFALEFGRGRAAITALWLASESAADAQGSLAGGESYAARRLAVNLPVPGPTAVLIDFLGRSRRAVRPIGGRVRLSIGPDPIYVWSRRP